MSSAWSAWSVLRGGLVLAGVDSVVPGVGARRGENRVRASRVRADTARRGVSQGVTVVGAGLVTVARVWPRPGGRPGGRTRGVRSCRGAPLRARCCWPPLRGGRCARKRWRAVSGRSRGIADCPRRCPWPLCRRARCVVALACLRGSPPLVGTRLGRPKLGAAMRHFAAMVCGGPPVFRRETRAKPGGVPHPTRQVRDDSFKVGASGAIGNPVSVPGASPEGVKLNELGGSEVPSVWWPCPSSA